VPPLPRNPRQSNPLLTLIGNATAMTQPSTLSEMAVTGMMPTHQDADLMIPRPSSLPNFAVLVMEDGLLLAMMTTQWKKNALSGMVRCGRELQETIILLILYVDWMNASLVPTVTKKPIPVVMAAIGIMPIQTVAVSMIQPTSKLKMPAALASVETGSLVALTGQVLTHTEMVATGMRAIMIRAVLMTPKLSTPSLTAASAVVVRGTEQSESSLKSIIYPF